MGEQEFPEQLTEVPLPQLTEVLQGQGGLHQVVTPLQVTCPRSFTPQLRSADEQLATPLLLLQLTVAPPPQAAVAEQIAFSPPAGGRFASPVDGFSAASEARKTWSAKPRACSPRCWGPAARTGEPKKPTAARAKDSPNTILLWRPLSGTEACPLESPNAIANIPQTAILKEGEKRRGRRGSGCGPLGYNPHRAGCRVATRCSARPAARTGRGRRRLEWRGDRSGIFRLNRLVQRDRVASAVNSAPRSRPFSTMD